MAEYDWRGFDFTNMGVPSMPSIPEQGGIKELLANPQFLSIALDKIGQSIGGPTTPLGGVGTFLGQSSLANKALQEQKLKRRDMRDLIAQIMGQASGSGSKLPDMTPREELGTTKIEINPGAEAGTHEVKTIETVGKPKKDQMIDLSELTGSLPLS